MDSYLVLAGFLTGPAYQTSYLIHCSFSSDQSASQRDKGNGKYSHWDYSSQSESRFRRRDIAIGQARCQKGQEYGTLTADSATESETYFIREILGFLGKVRSERVSACFEYRSNVGNEFPPWLIKYKLPKLIFDPQSLRQPSTSRSRILPLGDTNQLRELSAIDLLYEFR